MGKSKRNKMKMFPELDKRNKKVSNIIAEKVLIPINIIILNLKIAPSLINISFPVFCEIGGARNVTRFLLCDQVKQIN